MEKQSHNLVSPKWRHKPIILGILPKTSMKILKIWTERTGVRPWAPQNTPIVCNRRFFYLKRRREDEVSATFISKARLKYFLTNNHCKNGVATFDISMLAFK